MTFFGVVGIRSGRLSGIQPILVDPDEDIEPYKFFPGDSGSEYPCVLRSQRLTRGWGLLSSESASANPTTYIHTILILA